MNIRMRWPGLVALLSWSCLAVPVSLSLEDSLWIKAHPVVRVGIDRNRSPIEFVDAKGNHRGISSDVLQYISENTGIHFETVVNLPWSVVQAKLKEREIDMLASARPTEERKLFMEFTNPYLQIPTVIAVRNGVRYVESVKDLTGLRIALVKGNASSEVLLSQGLKVEYVVFPSYREALIGITKNKADGLLGNLVVLTHEIQTMNAPIRIAAPTNFTTALSMGVRNDWPELARILNKVLESLSEEELAGIKARWVNIPVIIGVPWKNVWKMGGVLFVAFAIVVGTILWANRKLKREIKERMKAESRALENEQNYRSLFHNLDQAFTVQKLVMNSTGKAIDWEYLEVNSAFGTLVGMDAQDIVGKHNSQIGLQVDSEWLEAVTKVAEMGDTVELERQLAQNGRWVRCSVFSSRRGTFAMILTDITDQKNRLVDMTYQRDEMSHFIYSVSHDLKGPILTISSFSQMLRDDLTGGNIGDIDNDLGYIHKAADRMSLLLEGLLEVAKLGRVELKLAQCKLEDLVQASAGLVEGFLRETGVVLRYIERNVYFNVDQVRMVQVFQNLFENAAKYRNPEGESWVDVKVERRGGELVLIVQDNGCGIPEKKVGSIFNIFEKVDQKSKGSGIGLALVKRIVELHKGRIWAESPGPGRGSSFCIYLPSLRLQS